MAFNPTQTDIVACVKTIIHTCVAVCSAPPWRPVTLIWQFRTV